MIIKLLNHSTDEKLKIYLKAFKILHCFIENIIKHNSMNNFKFSFQGKLYLIRTGKCKLKIITNIYFLKYILKLL